MSIVGLILIAIGCYLLYEAGRIARSKNAVVNTVELPSSRHKVSLLYRNRSEVLWPSLILTLAHGLFLIVLGVNAL